MTTATLIGGKYLIGAGLQFRGLVHCHYDGKHGNLQAGMIPNKDLESSISKSADSRKRERDIVPSLSF